MGFLPDPSRIMWLLRRLDPGRSEEHTSELQSQFHLVCRPLLENWNCSCSHLSFHLRMRSSSYRWHFLAIHPLMYCCPCFLGILYSTPFTRSDPFLSLT